MAAEKLVSNRKAQFYLFTAIVLIAYAFSIARTEPLVQEETDAFKELYENFITESPMVINNALYQQANVSEKFEAFASAYADYARTRQPNFRLAYILRSEGNMLVGNRLGLGINATLTNSTSYEISDGSTFTLAPQDIALEVAGISYTFTIGSEAYQVKSLFRQKTSTETRIFVNK